MIGKLSRLKNGAALRTDEVIGTYRSVPTVGRGFFLVSEPLEPGHGGRLVRTSTVKEIEQDIAGFTFVTENSIYRLDFVKDLIEDAS